MTSATGPWAVEIAEKSTARTVSIWLRNTVLLLFLPGIFFFTSVALGDARDKFYQAEYASPDYGYLMFSLAVAIGKDVDYFDHPGTTVDLLGAVCIRGMARPISARPSMGEASFSSIEKAVSERGAIVTGVLLDPERYLKAINLLFLSLMTCSLFMVGLVHYYGSNAILESVVLQLSPFLASSIFSSAIRVNPEPLLFCLSQGVVIVLLIAQKKPRAMYWLGFLLGLGLATKVTFLPMLWLILLQPSTRSRIWTALLAAITFVLATKPIWAHYPMLLHWLWKVTSRTGMYGTGDVGAVEVSALPQRTRDLCAGEPFFALVALGLPMLAVAKWLYYRRWERERRLTLAVLVCTTQFILTLKSPSINSSSLHYLVPALGFCGFVSVLLVRAEKKLRVPVLFCLIAGMAFAVHRTRLIFENSLVAKQELRELESFKERNYKYCQVVSYYRSSTPTFAFKIGSDWAQYFAPSLNQLFPASLFYNIWLGEFNTFSRAPVGIHLASGQGCLFYGTPGREPMEVLGRKVKIVYSGKSQALYLLDGAVIQAAGPR